MNTNRITPLSILAALSLAGTPGTRPDRGATRRREQRQALLELF